jgi:hypothetical protein
MGTQGPEDEELSPEFIAEFIADPKWGRKRLPYLVGLLEHDERRWRIVAAWACCLTASEYPETVEYLLRRLSDRLSEEGPVSLELTQALDYIASRHSEEVEAVLVEMAEADRDAPVPLPETGSFTRSHYYRPEPSRSGIGRTNLPGEARERSIRHQYEDDTPGPAGAGGGDGDVGAEPEAEEPAESSETDAQPEEDGTMGGLADSMDEVALIAAQSVYDDLNILAARHRGRYADVFRSLGIREEMEEALSLRLFHRPADETRWDAYARDLRVELQRWDAVSDHDHVVSVRDSGFQPRLWLASAYTGETLVDQGRLQPDDALRDGLKLAEGLSYVHQNDVVHGALDPRNVAYPGEAFGDEEHQPPSLDNVGLIHVYRFYFDPSIGLDPRFAAPEFFSEAYGPVDHTTDIYGLGAVLYRLFTGRPPFTGSYEAVRTAVTEAEPPVPSEAASEVPDGLDDVVATAMAKQKITRYETVEQLRRDLAGLGD